MGVCSLAKDQEILMWNRALEELTEIPALQVVGSRLSTIAEHWRSLLSGFIAQADEHLHKQRLAHNGHSRCLNLHKSSEERRVGKWCASTCSSQWSPYH